MLTKYDDIDRERERENIIWALMGTLIWALVGPLVWALIMGPLVWALMGPSGLGSSGPPWSGPYNTNVRSCTNDMLRLITCHP
jgi:hypothetical protein